MAKKRTKRTAKSVSYRANRFGIMNHLGGIWTPATFNTKAEAKMYVSGWTKENPWSDLRRHKIIPVRVTVTAVR